MQVYWKCYLLNAEKKPKKLRSNKQRCVRKKEKWKTETGEKKVKKKFNNHYKKVSKYFQITFTSIIYIKKKSNKFKKKLQK